MFGRIRGGDFLWKLSKQKLSKLLTGARTESYGASSGFQAQPAFVEGPAVEIAERITVDPGKCGARPCIQGLRIRVSDVLDMLASGMSADEILREFPYLEGEDIQACLRFASARLDYPIVAA